MRHSFLGRAMGACCAATVAFAWSAAAADGDNEYFIRTAAKVGQTHQPSVRAQGMGGAYTALSDGAASIGQNPAALGAMTGRGVEVMLGVADVDNGSSSSTEMVYRVGAATSLNAYFPSGRNQSIGAAYTRRDLDKSYATGEFDQDVLALSYASNYGADLLWGVTLAAVDGEHKYQYNAAGDMDRNTYSAGELTVGALYRLGDDFTVGGLAGYGGGSARSRRTEVASGTHSRESGDLDLYFLRLGAAWQIAPTTLLAGDLGWRQSKMSYDTRGRKTTEVDVAVGIEHMLIPEKLVGRAGVNWHRTSLTPEGSAVDRVAAKETDDFVAFTAGVGARLRSADINYTIDLRTNGDFGNYFSAQFDF